MNLIPTLMSFAPDQQKRVGSFTLVAIYLQIFEFSRTFCHFAFEFSVLFDVLVILNFPYFVTFLELVIAIHLSLVNADSSLSNLTILGVSKRKN